MPEVKLDDWMDFVEDQLEETGTTPPAEPVEVPAAPAAPAEPQSRGGYAGVSYEIPRAEPRASVSGSTALLKAMESRSSRELFGGKLFSWVDEEKGARMVGFAVTDCDPQTVHSRESEYRRLCDPYYRFLHFEGSVLAADCRVYLFRLPRDAYSLASLIVSDNRKNQPQAKELLRQLLGVLADHEHRFAPYAPLQCLCPHTVFIQLRSSEAPAVLVLPIRAEGEKYPVSIPRDLKPELSGDVYAAVHTICQYGSGVLCDEGGVMDIPDSPLIRNALLPGSRNRPALKELLAGLEGQHISFRTRPAARQGGLWQRLTGKAGRGGNTEEG